ncbi:MAG: hypothetical protein RI101_08245 [Nitrospira sp.]|jgi:hypothetical protein|nr:hypothetical protein [Nitrospira sp.]
MKLIATMICLLIFTGCASSLPYSIAIDDPNPDAGDAGRAHCVLRLNEVVKQVAGTYASSNWTVRTLQDRFEHRLHEATQALQQCTDDKGRSVQATHFPPIEEVAKKWLTAYAVDATDPDQELDRFREYVRSAILVQQLAERQLLPDQDPRNTYRLVEQSAMRQSQWCGTLSIPLTAHPQQNLAATGGDASCLAAQSLYHVVTSPTDLYDRLLSDMTQAEAASTPRNQRYLVLGYELPWDEDRTLVRYGVTFYFQHTLTESGQPSTGTAARARLIGYDLVYANEADPKPLVEPVTAASPERSTENLLPWQDNPWRITGYPFSLVIGLKNAAFELAKIPFSTIAGLAFGRDRANYPLENLETAYNALYVEATTQTRGGAEWGLYRLLLETPLVGQLFQYNFSFDRSEKDDIAQDTSIRRKLFLSRGIYGGNKWGQDTGLWALFAKHSYPTYDVYSPPYRHGTVIDVVWSMFNLSHGPAYSEVRYILDHASREDRLYLAGHSGGVQRSAAASQILTHHKYRVVKAVGIAGPSIGQALVDPRYPEAFKVYLNTGSGANQDVVSKVGVVAGGFSTLLDYAVIMPLKYAVGNLVPWKRDDIYQGFDRIGFSNATIVEVARKPSSRHQTPLRLSFTDRLVFDAYLRNEFATAFREDLERPDSPHDTEREHAVPWER